MKNIEDALLHEVRAARSLLKSHDAMKECGYEDNPFFDNYASVASGIYSLIGETVNYEDSITNLVLTAPYLTDERRVKMLMAEYVKNCNDQYKDGRTAADIMESLNQDAKSFFESYNELSGERTE